MFQTIRVSSCLTIQGEFVEALANGEVVVRDGKTTYRGQPIRQPLAAPVPGSGLERDASPAAIV